MAVRAVQEAVLLLVSVAVLRRVAVTVLVALVVLVVAVVAVPVTAQVVAGGLVLPVVPGPAPAAVQVAKGD